MVRTNRFHKMQRNVNRLSELFGVPSCPVYAGSAGRMTNGLYSRYRPIQQWKNGKRAGCTKQLDPRITLDSNLGWAQIIETTAHEFAHHLAYEWGLDCVGEASHSPLFWQVLDEVRKVILPGNSYTELTYNVVDRINKSWK